MYIIRSMSGHKEGDLKTVGKPTLSVYEDLSIGQEEAFSLTDLSYAKVKVRKRGQTEVKVKP